MINLKGIQTKIKNQRQQKNHQDLDQPQDLEIKNIQAKIKNQQQNGLPDPGQNHDLEMKNQNSIQTKIRDQDLGHFQSQDLEMTRQIKNHQ